MDWNFLCILALLFITTAKGQNDCDMCIRNYEELEASFRNNSGNIDAIRSAFYPPNRVESKVVTVHYCLTCEDTNQSTSCIDEITIQWMDDDFLIPIDFSVLRVVTFRLADLSERDVRLSINPFCDGVDEVDELTTLTSWLKAFVTIDDSNIIRGYALATQINDEYVNPFESKVNKKLIPLLILLLATSIAFGIVLHCGRIKESIIYKKLNKMLEDTEESYEKLLHLTTDFRIAIKNILQGKKEKHNVEQVANKLKLNDKEEEKEADLELDEQVESDDCKPVFLDTTEKLSVSFRNPLPYLSQSTVHWCIIAFTVVIIWDIYHCSLVKNVFEKKQWLLSPVPIWILVITISNLITTLLIQAFIIYFAECKKYCSFYCLNYCSVRKACSYCEHIYQIVVVFCVTSLPLYVIFHGVWIGIVVVSFPFRFIPLLVFLSFLISGWKWLNKNFKFIGILCVLGLKSITSKNKKLIYHSVKRLINELYSINGVNEGVAHRTLFIFSLVVSQFCILLIWILSLVTVYYFSDLIQDVSNIADNALTAIIAAIISATLISYFMSKLSPNYPIEHIPCYHFNECKITKVTYVCTRCESCKKIFSPNLQDGDSLQPNVCSECEVAKPPGLVARVVVTSGTNEISIFLTEQFISKILKDERSSVSSTTHTPPDFNYIKSRLLGAQTFNMSLNDGEIVSIEHEIESVQDIHDQA